MKNNLPAAKTENLPAIIAGKRLVVLLPERIVELDQRFENVSKIADAADRLMAIEALREDIRDFYRARYEISSENKVVNAAFTGTFGTTVVASVAAGAIIGAAGPVGMIVGGVFCGLAGGLAGVMLAIGAALGVEQLYDWKSGDNRYVGDLRERVNKLEAETLKTVDTRKIALSEHADTLFDRYPDLSAKFARAQAIDKVRAEEAAKLQIPSLDKQKPIS